MNKEKIDLSIIIVSYHAIDFLKLTLFSVERAIEKITAEVLLVDNSNDPQLQSTVQELFPFVKVIPNESNLGFAKANNKALAVAHGEIALLLNPDTIVAEDAFIKVIEHFKNNTTGGLGVKMIDGSGHFLQESKRNFPDISISILKFLKLSRFFSDSTPSHSYYANQIGTNKAGEVDILAGAFLAMPRKNDGSFVLLDEDYFMYGEDIDLSVLLKKEFGANFYQANNTIIHFKGQTSIGDRKMLWHFYHSMWLFYCKHIKVQKSFLTTALVWAAVKCIIGFKSLALLTGKNPNKEKPVDLKSAVLITNNEELAQKLQEQIHGLNLHIYPTIQSAMNEQTILLDTNYLSYLKIIDFIDRNNYQYGFISKDYSSLIICPNKSLKGTVISLQ